MNIPCLMITYNRLEYTKKALEALYNSDCGDIIIIDNGSTDGTAEWLNDFIEYEINNAMNLEFNKNIPAKRMITVILNKENFGIAYAINQFLELTKDFEYVSKVDNDSICPPNWCNILTDKLVKHNIDIIQAKHPIIKATHPNGWDGFIKTCTQDKNDPSIYYNHFVGGSGIVFRRDKVDKIPETESKIMGWREFQRQHPELKKAFCSDVEIELLDEHGYSDYENYYRETKRII